MSALSPREPLTAAGDGSGAEKYAVRESVPQLADTELRRGLE